MVSVFAAFEAIFHFTNICAAIERNSEGRVTREFNSIAIATDLKANELTLFRHVESISAVSAFLPKLCVVFHTVDTVCGTWNALRIR